MFCGQDEVSQQIRRYLPCSAVKAYGEVQRVSNSSRLPVAKLSTDFVILKRADGQPGTKGTVHGSTERLWIAAGCMWTSVEICASDFAHAAYLQ